MKNATACIPEGHEDRASAWQGKDRLNSQHQSENCSSRSRQPSLLCANSSHFAPLPNPPTKDYKSSSHLDAGLPGALSPSCGSQWRNLLVQRSTVLLAMCTAQRHFLLLRSRTQSDTFRASAAPSTILAERTSHSFHVSPSSLSSFSCQMAGRTVP